MRMRLAYSIVLCLGTWHCCTVALQTSPAGSPDLIIFSFDRPLQLYCLLESLETYVRNIGTIFVLTRASDTTFKDAYDTVYTQFASVHVVWQGDEPQKDFRPLLMHCLETSSSAYIMFATDDDVVTDYIDLCTCTQALDAYNVYGFYLRLGTNITYSYQQATPVTLPLFLNIHDNILKFSFTDKSGPWAYPHSVDMVIFRKTVIEHIFQALNFSSPNTLESIWHRTTDCTVDGLCFTHSMMVNLPLNLVQQNWYSKNENSFSKQELLQLWNQGMKIDISTLFHIDNNACHIPYNPLFIVRN